MLTNVWSVTVSAKQVQELGIEKLSKGYSIVYFCYFKVLRLFLILEDLF